MPATDFDLLTGEVQEQDSRLLRVPHLEQYWGAWAITPEAFNAHYAWFQKLDLHVHLQQAQQAAKEKAAEGTLYPVTKEGVALIELRGTLMKQVSSMSLNTSTVQARRQIRAAQQDPEVKAILLRVESPGGSANGTKELADDVAAAAKLKPVWSYIEDIGASAAYWIAASASKVFANSTALVGSIGTYMVVRDSSGLAAAEGVKVHIVHAGKFKGAGHPGTEVTSEHLAYIQEIVDGTNAFFVQGVAAGRQFSPERAQSLSDGRVHLAAAALQLGLIDGVQTLEQTVAQLSSSFSLVRSKPTMSQETTVPAPAVTPPGPATYQELKANLAGADPAFITSQLDKSATLSQAMSGWMAEQNIRIAAANEKASTLATQQQAGAAGVKPLIAGKSGEGDGEPTHSAGDFAAAMAERQKRGMSPAKAMQDIVSKEPALHAAYLQEHNAQYNREFRPYPVSA